ncbi:flagellar hook-length control protein FliK [Shimia isoporae]|uniref:Flagellar hook-length control protein FliK n=1 Tax=Shimia isoporae TaxID=647720 RepID=A0A4V2Q294_9RHOB|nr:flagellar hook-length control protein FliK [Shimia isoporae]TCL01461.1 flagellar hook-length control protein FliK [Shimia isoporae]
MLKLPFMTTSAPASDATKAKSTQNSQSSERKDKGSDFSDVYDQSKRDDGSQPVEPVQKRDDQAQPAKTDSTEKTQPANPADGEAETKVASKNKDELGSVLSEKIAAKTDEKAAGPMAKTPAEEASAFAKTIRSLEKTGAQPEGPTKIEQTPGAVDIKSRTANTDGAKAAKMNSSTVSGLAVETADELDPMRVQVRATGSAGSAAVQANLQANAQATPQAGAAQAAQALADAQSAKQAQTGEVDAKSNPKVKTAPTEEATAVQPREQTSAATATTLSWRPQSTEQAQQQTQANAGATGLSVGSEGDSTQSLDGLIGAREDSVARQTNAGTDIQQQTRFSQTNHNPAQVVKQVADAVKASDKGIIELTMDPPELGRLRVAMTEAAGVMNVTITTEQSTTSELMRKHIELLRKDFMEMGYEDVTFSFEQGDFNGQQSSEQPQWAGESGSAGAAHDADSANADLATSTPQTPQPTPTDGSGGLDIRL